MVRKVKTKAFGDVWLEASEKGLRRMQIGGVLEDGVEYEYEYEYERPRAHLERAEKALKRFLAGEDDAWDGVALDLEGMSDFQREVYEALRGIRAGETCTYGALAEMVGRPGAARAIGRAMATNRIPLAIPCHRVVGADGSMHGYSVGGAGEHDVGVKRALLDIEAKAAKGRIKADAPVKKR